MAVRVFSSLLWWLGVCGIDIIKYIVFGLYDAVAVLARPKNNETTSKYCIVITVKNQDRIQLHLKEAASPH